MRCGISAALVGQIQFPRLSRLQHIAVLLKLLRAGENGYTERSDSHIWLVLLSSHLLSVAFVQLISIRTKSCVKADSSLRRWAHPDAQYGRSRLRSTSVLSVRLRATSDRRNAWSDSSSPRACDTAVWLTLSDCRLNRPCDGTKILLSKVGSSM